MSLQKKEFLKELQNLLSSWEKKNFKIKWELLRASVPGCPNRPVHLYSSNRNKFIQQAYHKELENKNAYLKALSSLKNKTSLKVLSIHHHQIEDSIREMEGFGVNKFLL